MSLSKVLKPISIRNDEIRINPLPGLLSMVIGTSTSYAITKLITGDNFSSLLSAGFFGPLSLFSPYFIAIYRMKKEQNMAEKNENQIASEFLSQPYSKEPRILKFVEDYEREKNTYQMTRKLDLVKQPYQD